MSCLAVVSNVSHTPSVITPKTVFNSHINIQVAKTTGSSQENITPKFSPQWNSFNFEKPKHDINSIPLPVLSSEFTLKNRFRYRFKFSKWSENPKLVNRNGLKLCSPDQWPILKPMAQKICRENNKTTISCLFLGPLNNSWKNSLGLNPQPNCSSYVPNSSYIKGWDTIVSKFCGTFWKLPLNQYDNQHKNLFPKFSITSKKLNELANNQNYLALYINIAHRFKTNKSCQLFGCEQFKIQHFPTNISKVTINFMYSKLLLKNNISRHFGIKFTPPSNTVVNISNYQLSKPKTKLLERNLKCCPVPKSTRNQKFSQTQWF